MNFFQLAQNLSIDGKYSVSGPVVDITKLGPLVGKIYGFLFAFSGVVLLLMIIMAGFSMLSSSGDPKKIDQAKSRLTNALIGFMLIFAAFWITYIVSRMLGFQEGLDIFPM